MALPIIAAKAGKAASKRASTRSSNRRSKDRSNNSDTSRRKRPDPNKADEKRHFGMTSDEYAKDYTLDKRDRTRAATKNKSSKEREEMKRLNPHISNKFIDSPIISNSNLSTLLSGSIAEQLSSVILKVKAVSVSISVGSTGTYWYLFGQLPLYFFSLIFIAASVLAGFALSPVDTFFSLGGVEQNEPIGFLMFGGLAIGFSGLVTGIGWVFLFYAAFSYQVAGVNWIGGKKATLKMILLLFAFVGYGSAFFQFLPYALPWMIYVTINPE